MIFLFEQPEKDTFICIGNFISNIGEPKVIEVSLNLKEYIEINESESEVTDEEFENDYNGLGNW